MSAEQFLEAWQKTGDLEKGYTCDVNDSGGETCYGITVATARAYGYTGLMKKLPKDLAMDIAKKAYWDTLYLDDIAALSSAVAEKIFDLAYLCGQPMASMYFQRALNVFNRSDADEPIYPEVKEDYRLGKVTVYSFSQLIRWRGKDAETVMLRALNAQEGTHMIDVCRQAQKNEKFVFGWFLKRIG